MATKYPYIYSVSSGKKENNKKQRPSSNMPYMLKPTR